MSTERELAALRGQIGHLTAMTGTSSFPEAIHALRTALADAREAVSQLQVMQTGMEEMQAEIAALQSKVGIGTVVSVPRVHPDTVANVKVTEAGS